MFEDDQRINLLKTYLSNLDRCSLGGGDYSTSLRRRDAIIEEKVFAAATAVINCWKLFTFLFTVQHLSFVVPLFLAQRSHL